MKIRKMAIIALSGAMAALSMCVSAMAEDYITVRLNNIAVNASEAVNFGEYAPIQINSRTYVHSRGFAEAAGMIVGWDQEHQTAFLKVLADKNSDKPFERYAARQFELLAPSAPGTPSNITISLTLDNGNALLRYNYDIGEGHVAGLGKTVEMDGAASMIGGGALMVPLRSIMEMLGLKVEWNQETLTADISLPDSVSVPDGLVPTDIWIPENEYYTGNTPPDYTPQDEHEIGEYLGVFKLTKYCPCDICNSGWGANTAWAGEIIPGQTIGVNPDEIPKLAWVYIDGYGWRRAEDTGGGIGTKHIDIAVPTHYEATHGNIDYRDVWLAK